jgi:hypothetical protein
MPIPNSRDFERKVKAEFQFLVNDLLFPRPGVASNPEDYRDRIIYYKNDTAVEILNAWHPSDYGFEVNDYNNKAMLQAPGNDLSAREMVYFKVKEEQDIQFQFIEEGAGTLRQFLNSR